MNESKAPPLKTDPKYGFYPWWPEDGDDWLHPEDVELARRLIPSQRVWRRDGEDGQFAVLTYGQLRLRVRRALWREVRHEGFEIGDLVEVRSRGMKNDPLTAIVREMLWDDRSGELRYKLEGPEQKPDHLYEAADLRHVAAPSPRPEVRIEPIDDAEL